MKLRVLCAAGLIASAALPAVDAGAATPPSERSARAHLRSADRALTSASAAARARSERRAAASLRAVTRETSTALSATLRVVRRTPSRGVALFASVAARQHANVNGALDLLGGASAGMARAAGSTLASASSGRASALVAVRALPAAAEAGYTGALSAAAADAAAELAVAAEAYGARLSSRARAALASFVAADARGVRNTVAVLVANAQLDGDVFVALFERVAEARETLADVTGLRGADAAAVRTAVAALDAAAAALAPLTGEDADQAGALGPDDDPATDEESPIFSSEDGDDAAWADDDEADDGDEPTVSIVVDV